jgi:hypothetical protein
MSIHSDKNILLCKSSLRILDIRKIVIYKKEIKKEI